MRFNAARIQPRVHSVGRAGHCVLNASSDMPRPCENAFADVSAPNKKYSPPPPNSPIRADTLPVPRPLPLPLPPPGLFNKNDPPALLAPRTPQFPLPEKKINKNIRNVHQDARSQGPKQTMTAREVTRFYTLFSTFWGRFPYYITRKTWKKEKQIHWRISEAWGPSQFQEKHSRSEKAILGALGEFRGILGAALGIGNSILGIRNSILGMACHDLINTKPTILGATLGAIPGIAANPPERLHLPLHSRSVFSRIGVVPAHQRILFRKKKFERRRRKKHRETFKSTERKMREE